MSREGAILVVFCSLLTAVGNLLMRSGIVSAGSFSLSPHEIGRSLIGISLQPAFVAGFIAYLLAAVLWFRVLSAEPVSSAYPSFVGLTFILLSAASFLLLREELSIARVIGIALIFGGILLVARA